jgi:NADH-quinone oxidoreductase subunit M
MIGLPFLGALLVGLLPQERIAKVQALLVSVLVFLFSLKFYFDFDLYDGGFQFQKNLEIVPSLGLRYAVGLDGISLWFVLLTAFLTPLVVAGSFGEKRPHHRGFYACLLALEALLLGAFTATDLFLFYLFWEGVLLALYFLFQFFGGAHRVQATLQLVLVTLAASVLMLAGLLMIAQEAHTLDYTRLFDEFLPEDIQVWCFLAFTAAFLIQIPLAPFHAWLSDASAEAPLSGSIYLSALLTPLSIYGLVRYCVPLFPFAAKAFAPWILILALASIWHGGLRSILETDMKRLAAYLAFSQTGLVVLGLFDFSLMGFQAGLLQTLSLSLTLSGLYFLLGMLIDRRGSRSLDHYGGLAQRAPWLAAAFLGILLAAIGFPGFGNFIGQFLILISTYRVSPVIALAAIATVLFSAWCLITLYGKVFGGPLKPHGKNHDLSVREGLLILPLLLMALFIGWSPDTFLRPMEKAIQLNVIDRLKPPPAMMDFAVQQRHLQDAADQDREMHSR